MEETKAENKGTRNSLSSSEMLSFFLHQDNLMWNRLQTIGVIQIAILSSAYGLRSVKWLSLSILLLGIVLTLIVFFLLKRDELIREKIDKKLGEMDYYVPRKWFAFIKGREATWIITILLLVADIMLAVGIDHILAFTSTTPQINKDPGTQGYTNAVNIMEILYFILVCITAGTLWLTLKANIRAERLYVGQNQPLIDVTPIGISQDAAGTHATTVFSIINYSGFKAYNIGIDLKYGSNSWILEWIKARDEKTTTNPLGGVVKGKVYMSRSSRIIREIKPGETKENVEGGEKIVVSGSLKLESDVCAKGNNGIPVLVRVTWQNLNHHVFDEVHKYRLICTTDTNLTDLRGGRAFTFIPEGIISKKTGNPRKESNED
jgi:hypothetical protein